MRKRIVAVLFVLIGLTSVYPVVSSAEPPAAVKKAISTITAKELKEEVLFLASDALEGRGAGTAGEAKAVERIVKTFERLKLKPAVAGKFTQEVNLHEGKGWNVVALLEGADEKLKEEYVLVGGHHDHLAPAPGEGHGKNGDTIFNGADDNASGVAAILEIAEAMVEGGVKPKRSILFVTFTGEEIGLMGSRHYVEHPPVPLPKHAAMLNLDMIGRNPEKPLRISGIGTCAKWEEIVRKASDGAKMKCVLAPGYTGALDGNTDHEPFAGSRVPIICFFSGYHDDYHKSTDHADKLDYKRMEQVTRLVLQIALDVADLPEKPVFVQPGAKK